MDPESPALTRSEPDDGEELARRVRNQLHSMGYVHVPTLSETRFLRLAEELGPLVGRIDVCVRQGGSLLSSTATMPFHTDGPEAEIVAWWCVEAAETSGADGANLLIDTDDIVSHLDAGVVDELTKTNIRWPIVDGTFELHSCLFVRDGRHRIYYAPWHLLPVYESSQRLALSALCAYLRSRKPSVVLLRRGESLFVDNGRVLHGRTALPAETRRHLRRVWIGRQERR